MVTVAISRHGGGVWQLVHAAERVHGRPQDGAIGAQNGGQRGTKSRNTSMCGYVWQVPGDPCPLVCYFKECIEPQMSARNRRLLDHVVTWADGAFHAQIGHSFASDVACSVCVWHVGVKAPCAMQV